jgi:glycerate 2-kinase
MGAGVRLAGLPDVVAVEVPVADGGDGTLDVLLRASPGSRVERVVVHGPLGAPVEARLGWLGDGSAVVELAEASGLRLLGASGGLDAMRASTFGVGELLRAALDGGARRIVVGVGGSASTDGGAGLAVALGARLLDAGGAELPLGGGALGRLASVDLAGLDARLAACRIEVAVDVRSPLLGPRGAAAVFGPQKGASGEQVVELERGLARWALQLGHPAPLDIGNSEQLGIPASHETFDGRQADVRASPPKRPSDFVPRRTQNPGADARPQPAPREPLAAQPGTGAAGGAAFGLAAVCGATLLPGAALVCDLVRLDGALRDAALVLTGEGRLDSSTSEGKAPAEVARRAHAAGVPCIALAGSVELPAAEIYSEAIAVGAGLTLDESRTRAAELLRTTTAEIVRRHLRRR